MNKRFYFVFCFLCFICTIANAQVDISGNIDIDYLNPKEYEIGGITFSGSKFNDNNVLILVSGLTVGEKIKIPGEKISKAIQNLWKQGLFSEIIVSATKAHGNTIFLDIKIQERPRLSHFTFKGIKKSEADKIRDKIKLTKGDIVTDNLIITSSGIIKDHFIEKGYLNVKVDIQQKPDSVAPNSVSLLIVIDKNAKVKINKINIYGNFQLSTGKIKHALKKTKQKAVFTPFADFDKFLFKTAKSFITLKTEDYPEFLKKHFSDKLRLQIFKSSKFIEDDYKEDKLKIIEAYNNKGFRDAKILKDTVYKVSDNLVNINIKVDEGRKYYFRNLTWVGNTKYSDEVLNSVLRIKKGDVYDQEVLNTNLLASPDSRDVSSLYLDNGYLFFSINPVETKVENDSIDIEFRIYEGKQATISNVKITGNTKTNDKVILREIRTKPGQLFSRADIIRSQRELSQLKYFNNEKLAVNPTPNPADGTVDIEYVVEETSSDQVELSGGWGGGRIVGTLGLMFNNFSSRSFFKKGAWKPLPSGDGQQFSIRAQTNGLYYQSYNASFTEPWLGGKKPNALSFSVYHSIYNVTGAKKSDANRQIIMMNGASVGLGKRLKWPDDYFTLYNEVGFQNYFLNNYNLISDFNNGAANVINYTFLFGRSSIDQPIYPRTGSDISLKVQATPPYSLFGNKDYSKISSEEKYKWIEYHKWKFKSSWFLRLAGNLVVNTRIQYGFLGFYNKNLGLAPFERFYVGGDGLTGYNQFDGRELIALRGYQNNSLTPQNAQGTEVGGAIFDKYTFEIRYPISLSPMTTIYVLSFMEGGNSWLKFREFNPFSFHRSAGFGLRLFMPMFGLLGLDWGYGFDEVPGMPGANKGQFHFSIGQSID
jgi:outer membrane protein insertion porin family